MESAPARRRLLQVLLLAGSTLLAGAGAELALRCFFAPPPSYFVWPPNRELIFRPAPEVMPGIHGISRFRTNADGIRGDPMPEGPRYRILAVGGSTTECVYLDDFEAWPHVLQVRLNRALGGPRIWVGNIGKSALEARHNLVQLEKLLPLHPDLDAVILLAGINDFAGRLRRDADADVAAESEEALLRNAFSIVPPPGTWSALLLPREILRRIRLLGGDPTRDPQLQRYVQDGAGRNYDVWREHRRHAPAIRSVLPDLGPALEDYARTLHRIADLAEEHGVRLVMATQPVLWRPGLAPELRDRLWMGGVGDHQKEPGHEYYAIEALAAGMARYNARLLEVCRTRGAECVDLAGRVSKEGSQFYDDCHFTEAGAATAAGVLAEHFLREDRFD